MCGVFGFFSTEPLSTHKLDSALRHLFLLSESRGKEASGCAVSLDDQISYLKQPLPASEMLNGADYQKFFSDCFIDKNQDGVVKTTAFIGHSRLVTNGTQAETLNNQPVAKDGVVAVHNGIIVNDVELWQKYPGLSPRLAEVDTEIFVSLVRHFVSDGFSFTQAFQKAFREIRGATTVALLASDSPYLHLGTNNGSLYVCSSQNKQKFIFTSELAILRNFIHAEPDLGFEIKDIEHLSTGRGIVMNLTSLSTFGLNGLTHKQPNLPIEDLREQFTLKTSARKLKHYDASADAEQWRQNLKRCTQCLLPETFPLISFDSAGVCSQCRSYRKYSPLGLDALNSVIDKYRKPGDQPDCLVAISGGRDSCYGLHYIKEVLGLKPLTFTFDWGMVTDLARRNVARMCGELGVEHILVSADIKQKRLNIRKNIDAWLQQPDLGVVPLLMAGDKQYFTYAHKLAKEYDTPLMFFFPHQLEKTKFKSGFCGVDENADWYFNISIAKKMQLASYYMKQFITNPAYLNSSLLDTAHAFYSTYFLPNNSICHLFDYIRWDENEIVSTITNKYDWERAGDTTTTWRIGDGTSSFYNLIYLTMAGFTENDTYYSNHIREGLMSREEGLKRTLEDNQIRYEAIREYARIVGFDADEAIRTIEQAPKRYGPNGALECVTK